MPWLRCKLQLHACCMSAQKQKAKAWSHRLAELLKLACACRLLSSRNFTRAFHCHQQCAKH